MASPRSPLTSGKIVEIDVLSRGSESLRAHAASAAATATASAEQAQAQFQNGLHKGMKQAASTMEAMVRFQQGNAEALGKATKIYLEGLQSLAKSATTEVQAALEDGANTVRAMTQAKSVHELLNLQTGYARASLERSAHAAKSLTEQALKLGEEALAPLTARINAAVETTTDQIAALRR